MKIIYRRNLSMVAKLKEWGYDTTRIEESLSSKSAEVVEMPKSSNSES